MSRRPRLEEDEEEHSIEEYESEEETEPKKVTSNSLISKHERNTPIDAVDKTLHHM